MVTVIVLIGRIKFALLDNYAGMAVNKYLLIKFQINSGEYATANIFFAFFAHEHDNKNNYCK